MQSTNFEFLRPVSPELAELGAFAELYAHSDPPSSKIKSRILAEHLAMRVCRELGVSIVDDNFLTMLKELEQSLRTSMGKSSAMKRLEQQVQSKQIEKSPKP